MLLCLTPSVPRPTGRKNEALLDQVCDEVVERGTGHFVAQALSNIVWGSAILDHVSPPTLEVSQSQGRERRLGSGSAHIFSKGLVWKDRDGIRYAVLLGTRVPLTAASAGPSMQS